MQAGTNIRPRAAGDHAVVLGASMGGLAAARVLADAYRRVTVVDRDLLPVPGVQRRGVPQGRHAHGLLARGREVLEELFPGLTDELVARGALYGDVQLQGRWYN
jgi:2-polyprenyl-6-methoxyphenol hydroxylase-like FAD-dependent oxidoreductase